MPSKPPIIFPQEQQRLHALGALGLDKDLDALASDDQVGRKLQDLALEPKTKPTPKATKSVAT